MNALIIKFALAILAHHPAPHFDASHPVESCRAAEAAGVELVECDDVQSDDEDNALTLHTYDASNEAPCTVQ